MEFRISTPADVRLVASVLSAAADQLNANGMRLWSSSEISETAVAPHVHGGLYQIGLEGDKAVGVFRLETSDPLFWPEIASGTSAFLHKLAVHPEKQGNGLSHQLLRHAVDLSRQRGLGVLRLDCMGGRPKLRSVYERFGFRHHSQIVLNGQGYDRFEIDVEANDSIGT